MRLRSTLPTIAAVAWAPALTFASQVPEPILERERAAAELALPALDAGDLAVWRRYLLPSPDELRWREIPWLDTFAAGVLRAEAEKKPLLLWTMNGHPLGCT